MTAENVYLAKAKMQDVIDIMVDGDYEEVIPYSRLKIIMLLDIAIEELQQVKKDHNL